MFYTMLTTVVLFFINLSGGLFILILPDFMQKIPKGQKKA